MTLVPAQQFLLGQVSLLVQVHGPEAQVVQEPLQMLRQLQSLHLLLLRLLLAPLVFMMHLLMEIFFFMGY